MTGGTNVRAVRIHLLVDASFHTLSKHSQAKDQGPDKVADRESEEALGTASSHEETPEATLDGT